MAQELKPIEEIRNTLTRMESQLHSVLPSYISPEKFKQVVVTALQLKPDLLNLDRQSLYSSCLACASDGLLPDGREAALVPYKGKIAYQPMVGGLLKLIRNSGELASIDAQTVFEKDSYESYIDQTGPKFKHVKARGERGAPILTYAYAITKDNHVYHEEITADEMKKIEACAKTKDVWSGPFRDEQFRKSALKRLAKRLPKSTDLERVIERDNEDYDLGVQSPAPATTSSKLADSVLPQTKAEDAQIVPSSASELQVEGIIEKLNIKHSPEGSEKKWTKYGCKIGDDWYGTFDKKIWDKIEPLANSRVLIVLKYAVKKIDEKDIFEILDVEQKTATAEMLNESPI